MFSQQLTKFWSINAHIFIKAHTVELSAYPSAPGRETGEQDLSRGKILSCRYHQLPLAVAATNNNN